MVLTSVSPGDDFGPGVYITCQLLSVEYLYKQQSNWNKKKCFQQEITKTVDKGKAFAYCIKDKEQFVIKGSFVITVS